MLLIEGEVQALDVGVRVHVDVERGLHRPHLDLRPPVSCADAGQRTRRRDRTRIRRWSARERMYCRSVPCWLGIWSIGRGTSIMTLGMISGMTPNRAYFASISATRASAGQRREGKAAEGRLIHQGGKIFAGKCQRGVGALIAGRDTGCW